MSSGTFGTDASFLNDIYIARDGICFVVNASVDSRIAGVRPQQVWGIYSGVHQLESD